MDARTAVRRVFRRMVRARKDRRQKRPRGHFQPLCQHPARGIARDNPTRQPGRCQLTHHGLAGITPQARLRFHRGNRRANPVPERQQIGKEALCLVRPLIVEDGASLVQVRLLTGRTHQIRTQLASLGHPVLGDAKYGQARPGSPLYLHALRMILPEGAAFASLPPWVGARAVTDLPDPIACGDGLPLPPPLLCGVFPLGGEGATISLLH